MKKNIYCFGVLICMLVSFKVSAQDATPKKAIKVTANHKKNIQLEQFKLVFPYKEKRDTALKVLDATTKISITFTGDKGACTFYTFNDKGQKLITGQYKDADHLGNVKVDILDKSGNLTAMEVQTVFVPIPVGDWIYYSSTGEVIKKETYVKGRLMKD